MDEGHTLEEVLSRGIGGQRVKQLGFKPDIHDAALMDYLEPGVRAAQEPLADCPR